jgi:hypothetical protein
MAKPPTPKQTKLHELVLSFVRPQEQGRPLEEQLRIGAGRLKRTYAAVEYLRKKTVRSAKDAAQLLGMVAKMRQGKLSPMAEPGLVIAKADRYLRERDAGISAEGATKRGGRS